MRKAQLKVVNEVGLHARPAAMFVETANRFQSEIKVRNLTKSTDWVDAKSILGILTLAVEQEDEIEVRFEGADEGEAAKALTDLVEADFQR